MDAKAKVVPYSPRIIQTFKEAHVAFRADPDGKWISLTDHEAALAELSHEKDSTMNALIKMTQDVDTQAALLRELLAERDSIRSGLAALAGEWRKRATGCGDAGNYKMEIAYDCAADELDTLASSATGGKNTEEEIKS